MPLLDARDRLPHRPSRILVAGTSGSGKTTLARRIAAMLAIPPTEIDALYHGPNWTPRATFAADVRTLVDEPAWVTEWQYSPVRPLLAAAADTMVWLDLSHTRVMYQVIRRTVRRRLHHQQLWNGNVEPPLRTFFTDPENVVRWAWRTRTSTAPRVEAALDQWPDLSIVRLRSHSQADIWLTGPLTEAARRQ